MKITKPEMIIFDYGHTLLCEPDWNSDRGNVELMKYIVKNPNNCTIEDIQSEVNKIFGEIESVRNTLDMTFRQESETALHSNIWA